MKTTTKKRYEILNKNGDVLHSFHTLQEALALFAVQNPNHVTLRTHTEDIVVLARRKVNEKGNAIFE